MTDLPGVSHAVPRHWCLGPVVGYPATTVPELVLAQARRRPGAVAVRQWHRELRYADLVTGGAALAATLRGLGAGPEMLVGVCGRRRAETVVSMLGVMLAGAAYVPLDPTQPRARLLAMLDDADARLVVVDDEGRALFADTDRGRLLVAMPSGARARTQDPAVPGCPARPDNPAYVMYTSGSTGTPKGVAVPHRAVVSYATAIARVWDIGPDTTTLAVASFGFDVSVLDIFTTLSAGGTVALAPDANRASPPRLSRFAAAHRVTWACLPVSLLSLLDPASFATMKVLIAGAEPPPPDQVARWAGPREAPTRRFFNAYGPTEATVCVAGYETAGFWDRPLPIGFPLPNHRLYVVDEAMRLVPPGVAGELLIGGVGLARGYLGRPGGTAERFVPDPFSGLPGQRLYRTGDLVVWEPDGALRFLARVDRQVKVRGQRVEPGEVEAVLARHPGVRQALVEPLPGRDGVRLVAFVAPARPAGGPARLDPAALREHCAAALPAAMVPSLFVRVDALPRIASGKVDRAALRAIAEQHGQPGGPDGWHPATEEAAVLARAWTDVLGVPVLSDVDDFFDSGGHSIAAMRMVARLRADLDREVEIEDVLEGRTVAGIAARLASATAGTTAPAPPGSGPGRAAPALSPAQRRLWFLDRFAPDATAYNIAMAERLRGPLDVPALQAALSAVAERQEALRWRIPDADGTPYAAVDPPDVVPLPTDDLSHLPGPKRDSEVQRLLDAMARARFDLAAGPLWRARLIRLAPDEHVLGIVAHHAVFDGWSQELLYRDLGAAYSGVRAGRATPLPPAAAGYADYVAWRAERHRRRADSDLAWWVSHLAGAPTTLDLPRDRPRRPEQSFAGAYAQTPLSVDGTAALHRLARAVGATPSAVLLATLGQLVGALVGRTDILLGTPAVDRRHAAFLDLVGFFVEILPLRLRLAPRSTFTEHVRRARDELLDALSHPEAPIERIVDALRLGGDASRNPLAQVLFNAYNFTAPRLELPGLHVRPVRPNVPGSPFDLTLYAIERAGRFHLEIVYNPDLYDAWRAEEFLTAYRILLERFLAEPDRPTGEFSVACSPPSISATADPPRERADDRAVNEEVERAVAAVWEEVLGRGGIRVTDNFFDVGGTSFALVAVQQRLNDLLGCQLRVVDLFRHANVRSLAAYLDGAAGGSVLDRAAARGAVRRQRVRGPRRPRPPAEGQI